MAYCKYQSGLYAQATLRKNGNFLFDSLKEINQNTLVFELKNRPILSDELVNISTRSRGMVTYYSNKGSHYSKHCDNAIGNGRKLTAIYYANSYDWKESDGGILTIHPSLIDIKENSNDDNNSTNILPIYNRLVLFWSDTRCPHEVQPCYRNRYACTVWFIDSIERDKKYFNNNQILKPVNEIETMMSFNNENNILSIKIIFPNNRKLNSISLINIDMNTNTLKLSPSDINSDLFSAIDIKLSRNIDVESVKAKYNKKEQILYITAASI